MHQSLLKFVFILILNSLYGIALGTPYSNLIIFGDSQSDIGNFPESSNAGSTASHSFHGIPYNLYVPFANPISADRNPNLPTQPPINGTAPRQGLSLNWAQMLADALTQEDMLSANTVLVPWIDVYTYQAPKGASVDYAVAGALSTNHCSDEDYQPLPDTLCNEENAFATQALYRRSPNNDNLRHQVVIPGVQQQIAFFKDDLAAHRVQVDPKTLYIVWTGANDLSLAFHNMLESGNIKEFYQNISQNIANVLAGQNDSIVLQLQALGAQNIIFIGQQNLGLTPIASVLTKTSQSFAGRYINAYLLNLLILRYNIAVAERLAQLQQQYPDLNLYYIDLQHLFNRSAMWPHGPFYQTLGLACQDQNTASYQAILNGQFIDCSAYLYWNADHMTNMGNHLVALQVLQALNSGK